MNATPPISSLPLAISLDGSEEVPVVQGGTTKRTTTGTIAGLANIGSGGLGAFVTAVNQSSTFPNSRRLAAASGVTLADGGSGGPLTIGLNVIASGIPFTPAGDITQTNVQTAIQQVDTLAINRTLALTGTAVGTLAGSILNVSDDVVVTPTSTDQFGNFTPEGWYNVVSQTFNWTSGSAGTFTGARAPLLCNAFLTHPSSPSNLSNSYAGAILTCNVYVDDNGTVGTPKGSAFGLATVTYASGAVKHWANVLGAEFDIVCATGSGITNKVGVLVSSFTGDAVQGSGLDAGFILEANAGCPGMRNAFVAANSGSSALSADGTLLGTIGANTFTNAIDVSSSTVTGYLLKSTPLKITGQGVYNLQLTAPVAGDQAAMSLQSYATNQHIFTTMGRLGTSDFVTGVCGAANEFFGVDTIAGDAIVAYTGSLYLGHLASAPHMAISGNGFGYATGTGGAITQATSKATGVTLNKTSGQITMNNAALAAATIVSFVLTDTAIAATDVLILNHISGGTPGSYSLNAQAAAGSATINVRNNTAGSLSEAIVIQFAIIKAVAA